MNIRIPAALAGAAALAFLCGMQGNHDRFVNSIGVHMIRIPAGTFSMGSDRPTDPAVFHQFPLLTDGDYDEKPVHQVRISHDFYMSETEITTRQFDDFQSDHQDIGRSAPYATGVSWYEATAFCRWLSAKEKKPYRLPTEAEWEYAARAGAKTYFSPGDEPPKSGEPNAWGFKNMNTDAAEWVLDWHGLYSPEPQTDPVGPSDGDAKVVRGGGIMGPTRKEPVDGTLPYYRRTANRAGVAPVFRGRHDIGFRIVQAPMPETKPTAPEPKAPLQFVKQNQRYAKTAPDPKKPWFRRLVMLPIPPENEPSEAIVASGLNPALLGHNHSAGVTVCPNGDVLAIFFSASTPSSEYMSNTSFIAARRRFGSDRWEMPGLFYDFPDVNEQSALLWTDGGTVRFFGGGAGLDGVPFRLQSSTDNGATWTPIEFPLLRGPIGAYAPQPITSAFRDRNGTIYMATDAAGGSSVLWASDDNGVTWRDTGGRSAGRHTAFVLLKDGGILGMGGKNTNIDGYMPQAISRDGGKTWTVSKSQFPALASNQRPTIVRLASGRLFFAGDWQDRKGKQPAGITQHGAYVALSSDEGHTWKVKTLPETLPHEGYTLRGRKGWARSYGDFGTLGYTVAAQGPNGLIHLITSMNHPSLEFEMNEAWILSDSTSETAAQAGTGKLLRGRDAYPDGKTKATWSGKIDSAGRYMLDGTETWFYENGAKEYEVAYADGKKTGVETYWNPQGGKIWEWNHGADGTAAWTQYWPNGNRKHESQWRDEKCEGTAIAYSPSGAEVHRYEFHDGDMKQ